MPISDFWNREKYCKKKQMFLILINNSTCSMNWTWLWIIISTHPLKIVVMRLSTQTNFFSAFGNHQFDRHKLLVFYFLWLLLKPCHDLMWFVVLLEWPTIHLILTRSSTTVLKTSVHIQYMNKINQHLSLDLGFMKFQGGASNLGCVLCSVYFTRYTVQATDKYSVILAVQSSRIYVVNMQMNP